MIVGIDLYCGLGGLTHGLMRGGVHVVAGVDIDPECRFPYEQNNSARFIEADVCCLTGTDLHALWGPEHITLLAGCAPCQPFSTYSRSGRPTRQDKKWHLVAEFGRLVRESMPDLITVENVPQLADHDVFEELLVTLDGYYVWWDIVQCVDYGVPQTRKRLVLLASRGGAIALLPPCCTRGREMTTVRGTISHLAPLEAGNTDPTDPVHSASSLSELNVRRIRASSAGGTWREWPAELRADCHRRNTGETYPSVYGRMEWDAPAPTITTQCFGYGNGRFGHPEQHRAISLREAAMLQTLPETYQLVAPGERPKFSVLGRLIGNAVPVRLGDVVARSLRHHIEPDSDHVRGVASELCCDCDEDGGRLFCACDDGTFRRGRIVGSQQTGPNPFVNERTFPLGDGTGPHPRDGFVSGSGVLRRSLR